MLIVTADNFQVFHSDHITTVPCIPAGGRAPPTMIIFIGTHPAGRHAAFLSRDWLYAASEKGYITDELFARWMKKLCVSHSGCSAANPVVLILDSRSPHLSPEKVYGVQWRCSPRLLPEKACGGSVEMLTPPIA